MKLSEFRTALSSCQDLIFQLEDGTQVPSHFHITEMGLTTKHFIDCGGTERIERRATMQLWTSIDFDHRLKAEKVIGIMDKTHSLFIGQDPEVEVEYQMETIGRFGLEHGDGKFILTPIHTDCLAKENCGVPEEKMKIAMADVAQGGCTPGGGCC